MKHAGHHPPWEERRLKRDSDTEEPPARNRIRRGVYPFLAILVIIVLVVLFLYFRPAAP